MYIYIYTQLDMVSMGVSKQQGPDCRPQIAAVLLRSRAAAVAVMGANWSPQITALFSRPSSKIL